MVNRNRPDIFSSKPSRGQRHPSAIDISFPVIVECRQLTGRLKSYLYMGMKIISVLAVSLFFLFLLTGCASRESVYREVATARNNAYLDWKSATGRQVNVKLEGKLNLDDAVKVALQYNKPLQRIVQEKQIARGKICESYQVALPNVTLSSGYTRIGDRIASSSIPLDQYSSELKVVQPVFAGGAIPAALRTARLTAAFADEQVRAEVQAVIYETAVAYYDVLLAQHLFKVNADAVKSAEARLDQVEKKRIAEVASDFEVLRARVEVSNFRASMIEQKNNIDLSLIKLLKIIGASQMSTIELSDKLEYISMKPVFEAAVKLAHENRPDLYLAEIGVRIQREALRYARSDYWPKIGTFFSQILSRPNAKDTFDDSWGENWRAGVSLEWNVFDGLGREGRVAQERARLRQKEIDLIDTEETAFLEIKRALLAIRNAEELVQSQQLNREQATEALRLARVGQREGINAEVVVTDTRAALTQAVGNYYKAVYAHSKARLSLQVAMGILGPRPGSSEVPKTAPAKIARPDLTPNVSEFE